MKNQPKTRYFNVYSCQLVREKGLSLDSMEYRKQLSGSGDSAKLVKAYLGEGVDREHLIVILLNSNNVVIGINTVSIGTLNSSLAHPREVFKTAILANAAAIIVAHNHPAGNVSPSNEDVTVTKKLGESGHILGIPVLDHVVVTAENDDYYSFCDAQRTDMGGVI